jgi:hypothetical protein
LLNGARIAAKAELFGEAEALHAGPEEAESVEQGSEGNVPSFVHTHGQHKGNGGDE